MTTPASIFDSVQQELALRGIPSDVDYPGYLRLSAGTVSLDCGTANNVWGIDILSWDDIETGDVSGSIDSDIPGDSNDIQAIASFIEYHYKESL